MIPYDQNIYNVPMDPNTNHPRGKIPLNHTIPNFDMIREGLNNSLLNPPRDKQRVINPYPPLYTVKIPLYISLSPPLVYRDSNANSNQTYTQNP